MQSKNKRPMSKQERAWVAYVKSSPCIICGQMGPSQAHEIRQGLWFVSIPLCEDCHTGSHNGIHGEKHMWKIKGLDELSALNMFLSRQWSADPRPVD